MKARNILIFLSLKYQGDWDLIYSAISAREKLDLNEVDQAIEKLPYQCLTLLDSQYPEILKRYHKPPFVLFYYGDISLLADSRQILAVVGSRKCSSYGQKATKSLVFSLASTQTIISGLALGIDTIAHEAAITAKGKTIAVLGSGIDYCYPKSNLLLYEKIKNHHLIISEYPDEVPPNSDHFPFRNRIISALSWGVLVPESKEKSGTSVTITHAIYQGKEVMCVPFPYDEDSYNNRLIKDGATLVESAEQVLDQRPNHL
ncbi:MAG: DNA-processing protein DprA [Bacilli bacterium]